MAEDSDRDVSVIRTAAQLINNELKVQKYLDTDLKFLTIDSEELLGTSDSSTQPLASAFNNDRDTINIIYSLIKSVERGRQQRRLMAKEILLRDNAIEKLNQKVDSLHRQLSNTETKLKELSNFNQTELKSKITTLGHENKFQKSEITKLRNYCKNQSQLHEVEIKKAAIQIDNLKSQLIEKRNLSSTLTYGVPLNLDGQRYRARPTTAEELINSNVIINNIPSSDDQNDTQLPADIKQILTDEYGEIVDNLTNLIQSMTTENYRFIKYISLLSDYTADLNHSLSGIRGKSQIKLPKPTEIIDLEKFYNIEQEEVDNYYSKEEPFDRAVKHLTNNIYHNYHVLQKILEGINGQNNELHLARENANLKAELEKITKYWQDSLKTLQNWKKYDTEKA